MATFVLVHGGGHGGWCYAKVKRRLERAGHEVFAPSLTGLAERAHLLSPAVDLRLHVDDVVRLLHYWDLRDVVLVGHSYGGMVITGVADRVPDRIRRLIYVDALLPENGECVNDIKPDKISTVLTNGFVIGDWMKGNPPPPHDVPMPAGCFSEPITLTNQAVAGKLAATYILAVEAGKQPAEANFYRFYLRAQARGWPVEMITSDHNAQRSHPEELARLIEQAEESQ